ncbi:MAG: hypothetical protein CMH64_04670 [Nanoarchaeota archaeon]|nr:hypothetical protein [Nanoarchaeota archaeon]
MEKWRKVEDKMSENYCAQVDELKRSWDRFYATLVKKDVSAIIESGYQTLEMMQTFLDARYQVDGDGLGPDLGQSMVELIQETEEIGDSRKTEAFGMDDSGGYRV